MMLKTYIKVTLVTAMATLYSCFDMVGEDVTIATKILKDRSVIQLDYRGGGATASDVIWVSKKDKDSNKILIGKLKWFKEGYTTDIFQITDSTISIKFVDTSVFKGTVTFFDINLKDTIHYNDGSEYATSHKISN